MIKLLHLDSSDFFLNEDLIESIEKKPDTIITLITGKKIVVKNSVEEVVAKIFEYKNQIHSQIKVVYSEDHNKDSLEME